MVNEKDIINKVTEIYGITGDDLVSPKRYRTVVDARAVVCYVLCSLHYCTCMEVAKLLHRCHATVLYHNKRASEWARSPKLNPRAFMAIREIKKAYFN